MKILIADDHEFFRGGLVSELSQSLHDSTFFEASNATETRALLDNNEDIELAILDLCMPGSNQYELIEQTCSKYSRLKVIVMTASEEARDMQAAINCGASAYIPKTLGRDIVHHAINLVLSGGSFFPDEIANKSSADRQQQDEIQLKIESLTQRQKDVLNLLVNGLANKDIASHLDISENTVKIHVTAILKTLDFKSRTQVIAGTREYNYHKS